MPNTISYMTMFKCRDRFVLLENGYGQFIGRIKDTINRGGENIEPTEIETVLITHPDIANVQVKKNCFGKLLKKKFGQKTKEDLIFV